jgi:phenylpyruvate tautomerase PptA (4-oxalocrotonate tautomerase family)
MKPKIAKAITDAHVDATGAPAVFVHVYFNELPPGIAYSAGEPDTKLSRIHRGDSRRPHSRPKNRL